MRIIMTEGNQYIVNLEDDMMKKSRSTDSLSSLTGSRSCVCSPTKHPGSFRCRYHRQPSNHSNVSSSTASAHKADAAEALPPTCSSQKATEGLRHDRNRSKGLSGRRGAAWRRFEKGDFPLL